MSEDLSRYLELAEKLDEMLYPGKATEVSIPKTGELLRELAECREAIRSLVERVRTVEAALEELIPHKHQREWFTELLARKEGSGELQSSGATSEPEN